MDADIGNITPEPNTIYDLSTGQTSLQIEVKGEATEYWDKHPQEEEEKSTIDSISVQFGSGAAVAVGLNKGDWQKPGAVAEYERTYGWSANISTTDTNQIVTIKVSYVVRTLVFAKQPCFKTETINIPVFVRTRQPIVVEIDVLPLVPLKGAKIPVPPPDPVPPPGTPPKGTELKLVVTTSSPTKVVAFRTTLDNYDSLTELEERPSGSGKWRGKIFLSGEKAPADVTLQVEDVDFTDTKTKTPIEFSIVDNTPPSIDIKEPTEDKEWYPKVGEEPPFKVPVAGSVVDTQSGYLQGSLKYLHHDGTTDIYPTVGEDGKFSFEWEVPGLGPQTLLVRALDKSGNPGEEPIQITIASKEKPKTHQELFSSRAYLADLLRFIHSHVLKDGSTGVTTKDLQKGFMLDFGDIAEPGSELGASVVNELLPVAAVLRRHPEDLPASPGDAVKVYLRAVYEALLVAHGTSFEELRALPPCDTAESQLLPPCVERHALALRLGLGRPAPGSAPEFEDHLDLLRPPADDSQLEVWLNSVFGLPSTVKLLAKDAIPPGRALLAKTRQTYLCRRWRDEDRPTADSTPMLDPDLVDKEDLEAGHQEAETLWKARQEALKDRWDKLRQSTDVQAALLQVFSLDEAKSLAEIEEKGTKGEPIGDALRLLGLSIVAFRRLRFYQTLQGPLSEREKDDLAHLLTQVWKVRTRYPEWLTQEAGLSPPLWPSPDPYSNGAFVGGHFKRDFLPWRGSVAERTPLEQQIDRRLRDWDALIESHERAVLAAQRVALPLFRDELLGVASPPSAEDLGKMDGLTEKYLLDVAATGAMTRSLIDQSCLMLQSLVQGIRMGFFDDAKHPAFAWSLKTTGWKTVPKDDPELICFDNEWGWMSSYGTWRTAKTIYLYPENALYPDLLSKPSEGFKTLLDKLRAKTLTAEEIKVFKETITGEEKDYFVPVAMGIALERDRLYSLALDKYREVYDARSPVGQRAKVATLKEEKNQAPLLQYDDRWTLDLDPHENAKRKNDQGQPRWGNPYTRFTLARILRCLVALADGEFALGSDDARGRALALYLEAKEILGFDELVNIKPDNASEAYLPNPTFDALRDHVDAALRKLRRGLTYLGTPALPDPTRSGEAAGISTLVRPTLYRFKVLVERAKQLLVLTQNLEGQYLAALEKQDVEDEKYRVQEGSAGILKLTVDLRALQQTEAKHSAALAEKQMARTTRQRDRYDQWIAAGPNEHEGTQIKQLWYAKTARDVIGGLDAIMTVANALPNDWLKVMTPSAWVKLGVIGTAAASKGITQGFLNYHETQAQVSGILASQERRKEEWMLQRDLANQDLLIAKEQILLAGDRQLIADKEYAIADTQSAQAQAMLDFLRTKFTSREFYQWLSGVLAEVYAYLLRVASMVARQAEGQLAFERQQASSGFIKQDYWTFVSTQATVASNPSKAPDRRGITASARLLQDLTGLEQYAFDSERRLLNLSQTFSLAMLFPIEFEELRKSGLLGFVTTLRMFDEGFPGHCMRLIKRVRVAVVALIPPGLGIRATLSTSGLSRVVTADPGYPTMIIRQDPQSVALTSPAGSTGVFELDVQPELLYPFEGMGVDADWYFELPPAGNPFDFDTLFDVVMTIDYTALNSYELRDRVVKQLPRRWTGDLSFSVRRDLPDVWYDLSNLAAGATPTVEFKLERQDFPPGLSGLEIDEFAVAMRLKDGAEPKVNVEPSRKSSGSSAWISGVSTPMIKGLISTRQSATSDWSGLSGTGGAAADWRFAFADVDSSVFSLREALTNGKVDDILIVFTGSGLRPAWH